MADDFTQNLLHALKAANLSRTRLAKLVGVDKSVASRWVSGATRPSDANLDALTRAIATELPGLRLSDWSRPFQEFAAALDGPDVTPPPKEPTPATRPLIAVMPFGNLSGDPDQDFFGDGLAEDILTALAKLRWLNVVPRGASFAFKGKATDLSQLRSELGARYVLEGSVRRAGQQIRVSAQLTDAMEGLQLWADRYDRQVLDIFAVQDEIVGAVLDAIAPTIVDAERQRAFRKPTASLDAWEAYQRGLWLHAKRDASTSEEARAFFGLAVTIDPNFSLGYLGLCLTHIADAIVFRKADYDEALRNAEAMARKAIALDEGNPSARINLGYVFRLQGHLAEALREADTALAIEPASAEAHGLRGVTLAFTGDTERAREALETALRLGPRDPRRPLWCTHLTVTHFMGKDYERAAEAASAAVREYPRYPNALAWLATCLGHLGRTAEADEVVRKMNQAGSDNSESLSGRRPPFFPEADHARFLEGLRLAGWRG